MDRTAGSDGSMVINPDGGEEGVAAEAVWREQPDRGLGGVVRPRLRQHRACASTPPACAPGAHARLPPGHRRRWGSTPVPAEFTLHRIAGDAYASTDRVAATEGARFEVRGRQPGRRSRRVSSSASRGEEAEADAEAHGPHAHLLAHLAFSNRGDGDLTLIHLTVCIRA
ncbi:unnamed protein product [Miscanthus lutarioriparius]|uniref:Uncharacterized protein n=1 Tax=Miscanthus lutarioriparius TaxID=422564 RepID=A0A811PMH3_9POAL|nr:unnamed protein product [Miscanthus lutarioriparius]